MGDFLGLSVICRRAFLILWPGQAILHRCDPLSSPRPPGYALPKPHASCVLPCWAFRIGDTTCPWPATLLPRTLIEHSLPRHASVSFRDLKLWCLLAHLGKCGVRCALPTRSHKNMEWLFCRLVRECFLCCTSNDPLFGNDTHNAEARCYAMLGGDVERRMPVGVSYIGCKYYEFGLGHAARLGSSLLFREFWRTETCQYSGASPIRILARED